MYNYVRVTVCVYQCLCVSDLHEYTCTCMYMMYVYRYICMYVHVHVCTQQYSSRITSVHLAYIL